MITITKSYQNFVEQEVYSLIESTLLNSTSELTNTIN